MREAAQGTAGHRLLAGAVAVDDLDVRGGGDAARAQRRRAGGGDRNQREGIGTGTLGERELFHAGLLEVNVDVVTDEAILV